MVLKLGEGREGMSGLGLFRACHRQAQATACPSLTRCGSHWQCGLIGSLGIRHVR